MPTRATILALAAAAILTSPLAAQQPTDQIPIPPPLPRNPPPPEDEVPSYHGVLAPSNAPWGLSAEFLDPLFAKAGVYADYTDRFVCDETARLAKYDEAGQAKSEDLRQYGYLLVKEGFGIREYRQQIAKDGSLKAEPVKDEEPFPPAYAWVFLFSRFHEPYFTYRSIGERFDGFDWVYEIQFRGSLPFTDGKDIRQWEGTVLIDAVNHTPIEIQAEPSNQLERIESLYRSYKQGFNLMGFRARPKPVGYHALIEFRHRKDGLTFPTELRYDTFEAVSPTQVVLTRASVRTYSGYRVIRTETREEVGKQTEGGQR